MRKIVMAGNWKMNQSLAGLSSYVDSLMGEVGNKEAFVSVDVVVAMPYTLLQEGAKLYHPHNINVAAQNVHWEESGAYTGEVSTGMLHEVGVKWAVIGHSERRQYFGETSGTVAQRMGASLKVGMIPIVCIGETLEEREGGRMAAVLDKQIEPLLPLLQGEPHIIVAYEPVWAIGTGKTATPAQAEEAHVYVREAFAKGVSQGFADRLRILYGGSAKPGNIAELLANPNVDGALVGGASLKPGDFAAMIQAGFRHSER